MKARNKKTGEIVSNFNVSKEWGTASYIDSTNTLRFSTPTDGEWEIIDESDSVDWSSFRREAAKDILCAIINKKDTLAAPHDKRVGEVEVSNAIFLSDELIKQLKEERTGMSA